MGATVRRVLGSAGSVCPLKTTRPSLSAGGGRFSRQSPAAGHRTAVDHRAETAVLPEHVAQRRAETQEMGSLATSSTMATRTVPGTVLSIHERE